jgi:hypothetical protein
METLDLIISPISLSRELDGLHVQPVYTLYEPRRKEFIHRADGTFVSIALYDSLPKTGQGEWLVFL